jgi:hypothetical protein
MVGLSFCDFAGTREEKAMMATYRQQQWPRRYKVICLSVFFLIPDNDMILKNWWRLRII